MSGPEAFTMTTTVAIIGATIYGVARTFFNRPSKRALPTPSADPMLQDRFDRLEGAIQAIAIETERIAEGQRFTTKLLAQHGTPFMVSPANAPLSSAQASVAAPALPSPSSTERQPAP